MNWKLSGTVFSNLVLILIRLRLLKLSAAIVHPTLHNISLCRTSVTSFVHHVQTRTTNVYFFTGTMWILSQLHLHRLRVVLNRYLIYRSDQITTAVMLLKICGPISLKKIKNMLNVLSFNDVTCLHLRFIFDLKLSNIQLSYFMFIIFKFSEKNNLPI
jgi:hypothetical protein